MTERSLIRMDDYYSPQRPVFEYTLVDSSSGIIEPFDMSGCTIRATFKVAPTEPNTDPTDTDAPLKADIAFGMDGSVTSATNWALPAGKTAADGILHLVASKAVTAGLPLNAPLKSDIQVTDAAGHNHTVILVGTLKATEGFTNRGGD